MTGRHVSEWIARLPPRVRYPLGVIILGACIAAIILGAIMLSTENRIAALAGLAVYALVQYSRRVWRDHRHP